jgi:hypothetical protein
MRPRFQADENLNTRIITGLLRRKPALDFRTAKDARILGLSDFAVLTHAARDGRILVSHDQRTMPAHFARFLAENTSSGLLIISQKLPLRDIIEQLLIVWSASEAEDWINRIMFLPF